VGKGTLERGGKAGLGTGSSSRLAGRGADKGEAGEDSTLLGFIMEFEEEREPFRVPVGEMVPAPILGTLGDSVVGLVS